MGILAIAQSEYCAKKMTTMIEDRQHHPEHIDLVLSHRNVRIALARLGVILPVLMLINGFWPGNEFQSSISHFYHTAVGDVLVGTLCAIGVFLIAYKGYDRNDPRQGVRALSDRRSYDRWITICTGAGAIGVALFPVDPIPMSACPDGCPISGVTWHGNIVHFGSAFVFFVGTAVMCFVVFPSQRGPVDVDSRGEVSVSPTLTLELERLEGRWQINIISHKGALYLLAGWTIILAVLLLATYMIAEWFFPRAFAFLESIRFFFIAEVLGVLAFAAAWYVKSLEFKLPEKASGAS